MPHGTMLGVNGVDSSHSSGPVDRSQREHAFNDGWVDRTLRLEAETGCLQIRQDLLRIRAWQQSHADQRITCTVREVQFQLVRKTRIAAIVGGGQLPQSGGYRSRCVGGK